MSGFENFNAEAASIELELERKGVMLGIDWDNAEQVRLLARAALDCKTDAPGCGSEAIDERTRVELFGLAQLMLKVMTESAGEHMHTHGGRVWKNFARALWAEREARGEA